MKVPFVRNDGVEDTATIGTRKTKFGFTSWIEIGTIRTKYKTVFTSTEDASRFAITMVRLYRDGAVYQS